MNAYNNQTFPIFCSKSTGIKWSSLLLCAHYNQGIENNKATYKYIIIAFISPWRQSWLVSLPVHLKTEKPKKRSWSAVKVWFEYDLSSVIDEWTWWGYANSISGIFWKINKQNSNCNFADLLQRRSNGCQVWYSKYTVGIRWTGYKFTDLKGRLQQGLWVGERELHLTWFPFSNKVSTLDDFAKKVIKNGFLFVMPSGARS